MADTGWKPPNLSVSEVDENPKRTATHELVFPNGTVAVSGTKVTISFDLSSLSDASITSAVLHQHLEFDGTNWVNVSDLTQDWDVYLKAGKKLYFDG